MNIHAAITFIQSQGNVLGKSLLTSILWGETASEEVLQALTGLQKPDGGLGFCVRVVSSLCGAAYMMHWFDDLRVRNSDDKSSLLVLVNIGELTDLLVNGNYSGRDPKGLFCNSNLP